MVLAAAVWVGGLAHLSPYSSLALAYILAVVGARPFVRGFQRSLVTGRADADMLVIFGVWAALAQATMAVFVPDLLLPAARRPFFEVLGALVVFPAIGRRLEELLTDRGGEALWILARRIPSSIRIIGGDPESMVSVAGAAAGARFRVLPGEHIPLDGAVVGGRSRVDESLWTGRAAAIEKSAGSRVWGGSLNKTGVLTVAAESPAADMQLTRIVETVRAGVQAKASVPGVADQLAASYAPGVLIVAVVAALAWSWKGPDPRLERALTTLTHVLVAACPWTFGLAVPAALAAGLRRARRMGLKVRNPSVLQVLRPADVVVVGKTGVLTVGRPTLISVEACAGFRKNEVLSLARAAASDSGHPYSEALGRGGSSSDVCESADSIEIHPGYGVSADVGGRRVLFGSLPWLAQHGIVPKGESILESMQRADPVVGVAVDGVMAGVVVLSDPLRPSAADEVKALARIGVAVVLASGDREAAVRAAAEAVGITQFYAELLEEDKLRIVTDLQAAGNRVAMVGEGFQDAPALSRSDLGIALGANEGSRLAGPDHDSSGFDLAAESADLVLGRRDLASLFDALRLVGRIREVVRENLTLAFLPQLALLPLAAGVFGPSFGVVFQPSYAAFAALLSAVAIAINSIRRLRL